MNTDELTNPHSIAGTAYGAVPQAEMQNSSPVYSPDFLQDPGPSLQEASQRVFSSISFHLTSLADISKSNKYQADFDSAALVGGAISVQPLFGRFILCNVDNEENNGVLRADGKNSHLYSSSSATTLGSQQIDTVNGMEMNPLSSDFPSSFFTPVKTWMPKMFPILSDRRLVYIAVVEGILLLWENASKEKKTMSEQILERDLATIIVDNQEIEDQMLLEI